MHCYCFSILLQLFFLLCLTYKLIFNICIQREKPLYIQCSVVVLGIFQCLFKHNLHIVKNYYISQKINPKNFCHFWGNETSLVQFFLCLSEILLSMMLFILLQSIGRVWKSKLTSSSRMQVSSVWNFKTLDYIIQSYKEFVSHSLKMLKSMPRPSEEEHTCKMYL